MRKGAGLIEIMIVLFLAAMLLHIGTVSFHKVEPLYRLQAAVWEVVSQMNHARFRAILNGAPVRVIFSSGHYSFEEWDEELEVWRTGEVAMVRGIRLTANNSPTFHPEGTVSNLATIGLSNSRGAYKITLAITGRIKVTRL